MKERGARYGDLAHPYARPVLQASRSSAVARSISASSLRPAFGKSADILARPRRRELVALALQPGAALPKLHDRVHRDTAFKASSNSSSSRMDGKAPGSVGDRRPRVRGHRGHRKPGAASELPRGFGARRGFLLHRGHLAIRPLRVCADRPLRPFRLRQQAELCTDPLQHAYAQVDTEAAEALLVAGRLTARGSPALKPAEVTTQRGTRTVALATAPSNWPTLDFKLSLPGRRLAIGLQSHRKPAWSRGEPRTAGSRRRRSPRPSRRRRRS
jgi:hypothetical protein